MAATDLVSEQQVDALAIDAAAAIKALKTLVNGNLADLAALTTTDKTTVVNAINEVKALVDVVVGSASTNTTAIAANLAAIGVVGDLDTTASDLVEAINEVKVTADAAGSGSASINDAATNTTETWSSQKISDEAIITADARINSIFGGASNIAALLAEIDETDLELIARIGDTVSYTNDQTARTAGEKLQARTNIGVITSTADFAATFNTALT